MLLLFTDTKLLKMTDRKAVIKNADMSEDMQQDAVDCATQALEKYNIEKVRRHSLLPPPPLPTLLPPPLPTLLPPPPLPTPSSPPYSSPSSSPP